LPLGLFLGDLLLDMNGLLVEGLGLVELCPPGSSASSGRPSAIFSLAVCNQSAIKLGAVKFLTDDAVKFLSGIKTGIEMQGIFGGQFGFLDIALPEETRALVNELLALGRTRIRLKFRITFSSNDLAW